MVVVFLDGVGKYFLRRIRKGGLFMSGDLGFIGTNVIRDE